MDLLASDEQLEIVNVVADFLSRNVPTSVLRDLRHASSSIDLKLWSEVGEMGWFGLGLAEQLGGVGYGLAEESLLFREIGRFIAPGPLIATTLGARVAALAGVVDVAAAIVSGASPVALATARDLEVVVGKVVTGSFDLFDAPGAAYVLVIDRDAAVLIDATTAAVTGAEVLPCIDPAVRLSRVALDDVPVIAHVSADLEPIHLRGTVLVSAMLTGIAEATRDMGSQYAKDRVQFGRPIGVNQAIKHACADMALRAEAATQQLVFAALSIDEGRGDSAFQVAAARIVASDGAIRNAEANIQIHGGMGYTFEHDAHLYVKRARVLDHWIGDVRSHQAALLAMSGAQ